LLATSRALLIVRGIDSARPDEILRAFETHFLDARLVGEEFRHLLSRGRGYLEGWGDALAGRADEIRKLLERVELLFSTLDANLEFHPPEATVKPALGDNVPGALAAELDLRGVACPLNFVKAKLRLESLAVGQTLKLVLDEGEPIQNVPASFRQQGQSVIQTTSLGGGKWQVIIRKEK
jgi:sulfite reductase (ferredoxin)